MIYKLDGPINALSVNKCGNRVAVAGRNILKIFSLRDDTLTEECNLKCGKPAQVLSCQDVVWHHNEEGLIASASTNGSVVVWNIDNSLKCKDEMIYNAHKRTVNKVAFHPTEIFLMISGSQDSTIKLFDLRRSDAVMVFSNGADSVRDLQFSYLDTNLFVAADEAGNVRRWDIRKAEKPERSVTAHGGPVLSLDFHPERRSWLATGGRDRTIKVWDWSREKPFIVHSVQTTASVNRVKWRPGYDYHIASCSMVIDCSIHIWDITQCFVPFATFDEHKDVATGVAWISLDDADNFLSCGKDGFVVHHRFKDAYKPKEMFSSIGLTLAPGGNIATSGDCINSVVNRPSVQPSIDKSPQFLRKQYRSYLGVIDKPDSQDFVDCARNYSLFSDNIIKSCLHNAEVAGKAKNAEVAQSWTILAELFDAINLQSSQTDAVNTKSVENLVFQRETTNPTFDPSTENLKATVGAPDTETDESVVLAYGKNETFESNFLRQRMGSMGMKSKSFASRRINNSGVENCMFFGDGDLTRMVFDYTTEDRRPHWALEREAFEPRRDFGISADDENVGINNAERNPVNDNNMLTSVSIRKQDASKEQVESTDSKSTDLIRVSSLDVINNNNRPRLGEAMSLVKNLIEHHASKGDIQSAVSILTLLNSQAGNLIDEEAQIRWIRDYVDVLERHRLYTPSSAIIKHSSLSNVYCLSQQSTLMCSSCGQCCKQLQRQGWYCRNCKVFANACAVCNTTVRGMFAMCHSCGHGGHVRHLKDWFVNKRLCPAGCGHKCEFGQD